MRSIFKKAALLALAAILLVGSLVACSETKETGACDMEAVKTEIGSMKAEDFVETDKKTEYVKITVKGYGDMILRLRADVAPITVANFQNLVAEGFYNGVGYHRIMKGFMIQGGDPNGDGNSDPSQKTIKGEFSANGVRNDLLHMKGVISMARTSMPDSASSQFFLCNDTNDTVTYSLDGKYAGFGYLVAGLDVLDAISNVEVTYSSRGELSVPVEPVVMEKVCFVKKK